MEKASSFTIKEQQREGDPISLANSWIPHKKEPEAHCISVVGGK